MTSTYVGSPDSPFTQMRKRISDKPFSIASELQYPKCSTKEFTFAEEHKIWKLYKTSEYTQTEIAEMFHVSHSAIHHLIKRLDAWDARRVVQLKSQRSAMKKATTTKRTVSPLFDSPITNKAEELKRKHDQEYNMLRSKHVSSLPKAAFR